MPTTLTWGLALVAVALLSYPTLIAHLEMAKIIPGSWAEENDKRVSLNDKKPSVTYPNTGSTRKSAQPEFLRHNLYRTDTTELRPPN